MECLRCHLYGALLLVTATLSTGCRVQHVQYEAGAGQTGYYITCGNKFERCEEEARDLCPHGYEKVSSSRRSKLDSRVMVGKVEREYSLDVVCEQPVGSEPRSGASY